MLKSQRSDRNRRVILVPMKTGVIGKWSAAPIERGSNTGLSRAYVDIVETVNEAKRQSAEPAMRGNLMFECDTDLAFRNAARRMAGFLLPVILLSTAGVALSSPPGKPGADFARGVVG